MRKILFLEYFRVCAMILLVLYHCLCYYTNRWTYDGPKNNFLEYICGIIVDLALPLFVFVSGYLYRRKYLSGSYNNFWDIFNIKIKRLILPWLFWSVCFNLFVFKNIPGLVFFIRGGYKHLWFLLMLFWLFCFSPIFNYFCEKKSSIVKYGFLILLILFSWLFTRNPFRQLPLLFSVSITYMCYFYLGCLLSESKLFINKILLYVSIFGYLFLPLIKISMDLNILILNIFVVIIIIHIVNKFDKMPLKDSNYLFSLSKYSMGIYIFHHVIIDILLSYTWFVSCLNRFQWMSLFLFLFVFLVSWLISKLLFLNKKIKVLI